VQYFVIFLFPGSAKANIGAVENRTVLDR